MNLIKMIEGCLEKRDVNNYVEAIGCIGVGYNPNTENFSSFSYMDIGHEIDDGRKLSPLISAKLLIRETMFFVKEHMKNPVDVNEFSEKEIEEVLDLIISKVSKK